MDKRSKAFWMIVAGGGWLAFGLLALGAVTVSFWVGWAALVAGLGLCGWGLDLALTPTRW